MNQLDLFPAPPSPPSLPSPTSRETPCPLSRYVTRGAPVAFTDTMTVCAMHLLWEDLWDLASRATAKLEHFAGRCEQRRAQSHSFHEKKRLRTLATRAHDLACAFNAIPERLFMDAQEQFNRSPLLAALDDDETEIFWAGVQDRPGTEYTWEMTLAAVAHWIKSSDV